MAFFDKTFVAFVFSRSLRRVSPDHCLTALRKPLEALAAPAPKSWFLSTHYHLTRNYEHLSNDRRTDQKCRAGPGDVEWRYEMRRECQEILPGLLLGPFVASKSLETLQGLGITHIVCIRDAKEAFSVRPRFPEHFQYLTLDVEDNEEQNLIRLFPRAKAFIDDALREEMGVRRGKVLVHCNGGISLSPAFVVMFVMEYYRLSWEDALHLVQNRRYCISPNGGFLTQIKEYEAIYRASQAVATYPQAQRQVMRRKRADDDDDDDDEREEDRKRPLVDPTPAPPFISIPLPSVAAHDPDAMEIS